MNTNVIRTLIIGTVIILFIIIINRKNLIRCDSIELLSDEKMYDYVTEFWVKIDEKMWKIYKEKC